VTARLGPLGKVILIAIDMDAQVRFYRDTLGLTVAHPAGLDDYADQVWVEFDTGACSLALHGGGKGRLGDDAPKIVFDVDDVTVTREVLLALGVDVGEVFSPAPGIEVAFCRDPEGNRFSIDGAATG
jgi:catechol 2,3-dioxygenase-like lactoylglutathione lyase family enzyme